MANFDSKLDRTTRTLLLKGFWLEDGLVMDRRFQAALKAGFKRFLAFLGARRIDLSPALDSSLTESLSRIQ